MADRIKLTLTRREDELTEEQRRILAELRAKDKRKALEAFLRGRPDLDAGAVMVVDKRGYPPKVLMVEWDARKPKGRPCQSLPERLGLPLARSHSDLGLARVAPQTFRTKAVSLDSFSFRRRRVASAA